MKRRVIQIANSTQLISLPRKWTQKYNIAKGDELEIEERGNKLTVGTDKEINFQEITIDVSDLDRTSILYYIQSLYRAGYDEIHVRFSKSTTKHLRKDESVTVISVIHKEVNRLIGYEIIEQKENSCIIKDLSQCSIKEFPSIIKRIFLLLNDASKDLIVAVEKNDQLLLKTLEEKHDSITKFISYCLRLINKFGLGGPRRTTIIYHILATLDRMADFIKYVSRDLITYNQKLHAESISLFQTIDDAIHAYRDFFMSVDISKTSKIYLLRQQVLSSLRSSKKIPADELLIMSKYSQILELLLEIKVARMGLKKSIDELVQSQQH